MHGVYTENSLCTRCYTVFPLKREPWLNSPLKAHREPQAAISSNWQLKLLAAKVIGAYNFTNARLALYRIFCYLAANHGYQITASHIAFPVTQS